MDLLVKENSLVELSEEEIMQVEGGFLPVIVGYALMPVGAKVYDHFRNVYKNEYNKEMKYIKSKYGK